jgi:hypothetical protein
MSYFLDLFSPETYEAFGRSSQNVSGFRRRQENAAKNIHKGDILVCYITKLSRWFGLLEVQGDYFTDGTPIFYPEDDPFVIRFNVKPLVWLPVEKALPIHEDFIWKKLSFTRKYDKTTSSWTGKLRNSLNKLSEDDGTFLDKVIRAQVSAGNSYPIDHEAYQRFLTSRVRRPDGVVSVTVPQEESAEPTPTLRESFRIQALLAEIGEKMGFQVWVPVRDRNPVMKHWKPKNGTLLERLPLNYDTTTLKTIEQIDIIWLRRRSIVRAFEVEHTTAVYSGILRMADLLALQPNMDIRLHIVAPAERREKVFQEITRPVFALLEKGPLADTCTFLAYDSLRELASDRHLMHMSDTVLEEYGEEPI